MYDSHCGYVMLAMNVVVEVDESGGGNKILFTALEFWHVAIHLHSATTACANPEHIFGIHEKKNGP